MQGGDFTYGNGLGGESIYGGKFEDEFTYGVISHDRPFLLSMANNGKNTNNSQFLITFAPCEWLNDKHVVFGCVKRGISNFRALEKLGSRSGCPRAIVRITDCGELKNDYPDSARTPPPKTPPLTTNRFSFFYSPRGSPRKRTLNEKKTRRQLQSHRNKESKEEERTPLDESGSSVGSNSRVKDD